MKWLGFHAAAGAGKDTAADFVVKVFGGEKVALADPLKHYCKVVLGFSDEQLWGPSEMRNAVDKRYEQELRAGMAHVARVHLRETGFKWISEVVLPYFDLDQHSQALRALNDWLEDVLNQEHVTPRYALQTLGTEWGRTQDEDIWLKYADTDASKRGVKYGIIPDCRFLNEGAFIQYKKGLLIEVTRPGYEGQDALKAGVAAHPSEMNRINQRAAFRQYITNTVVNDGTLEDFYAKLREILA